MTENYIKPEDVNPEDTQRVLDFLNSAKSAKEIADAVEISHERDVGEIVASHILSKRNELGKFTNLKQVADVWHVGPERFTEIVQTLCIKETGGNIVTIDNFRREITDYKYSAGSLNGSTVKHISLIDETSQWHSIHSTDNPEKAYKPSVTDTGSVIVHVLESDFSQYLDILRNEKPVFIILNKIESYYWFIITTQYEPVGEEEALQLLVNETT